MNRSQSGKTGRRSAVLKYLGMVFCDLLIAGVILCIFAYFHHIRITEYDTEPIVVPRPAMTSALPEITSAEITENPGAETVGQTEGGSFGETGTEAPRTAETEPAATEPQTTEPPETEPPSPYEALPFYAKFRDRFSDTVIRTDRTYRSPTVSMEITEKRDEKIGCTYYVTDFYIAAIDCLQTCFAEDRFGKNITEKGLSMYERTGAVFMVNGDYYGARDYAPVIRNGAVYRTDAIRTQDLCMLYYDGTVKTESGEFFDRDAEMQRGVYQCWAFGPTLLDGNGKACSSFQSWYQNITGPNPRTAFGYYEPGHYCFVTVDGRTSVSSGMTFEQLAALMESLGCRLAYAMDGGISSFLAYNGKYVNVPPVERYPTAPRAISDAIFVKEYVFGE